MMEEGLKGCDLADSEHTEEESKVTECRQPPEARKSKGPFIQIPGRKPALLAPWDPCQIIT